MRAEEEQVRREGLMDRSSMVCSPFLASATLPLLAATASLLSTFRSAEMGLSMSRMATMTVLWAS
jgi:hypothetical protein